MEDRVKVSMEHVIRCSPKVLFNRLSTASGLSEWFADDVNVNGSVYTFTWDGSEQEAEKTLQKDGSYVRYNWLDEDDGVYFEFRISQDELTGDVSLIVIDYALEDEVEETEELWNTQIADLKHILGS